jgi:hypothetical protein
MFFDPVANGAGLAGESLFIQLAPELCRIVAALLPAPLKKLLMLIERAGAPYRRHERREIGYALLSARFKVLSSLNWRSLILNAN